jgi:hypothetical protein
VGGVVAAEWDRSSVCFPCWSISNLYDRPEQPPLSTLSLSRIAGPCFCLSCPMRIAAASVSSTASERGGETGEDEAEAEEEGNEGGDKSGAADANEAVENRR